MKLIGHDVYQVAFSYKSSVLVTPTARIMAEEMLFKNRTNPLFHEWKPLQIEVPLIASMSAHLKKAIAKN